MHVIRPARVPGFACLAIAGAQRDASFLESRKVGLDGGTAQAVEGRKAIDAHALDKIGVETALHPDDRSKREVRPARCASDPIVGAQFLEELLFGGR